MAKTLADTLATEATSIQILAGRVEGCTQKLRTLARERDDAQKIMTALENQVNAARQELAGAQSELNAALAAIP